MESKSYIDAIRHAILFREERILAMREQSFKKFNEAANRGIPFQKRESLIETQKRDWCDGELAKINQMKKRAPKPLAQWIEEPDYDFIKEHGFHRFMEISLERSYPHLTIA